MQQNNPKIQNRQKNTHVINIQKLFFFKKMHKSVLQDSDNPVTCFISEEG